ncbi:aldo/keto reductase [Sorangium sp. So ce204]|uniref:aldo/keto reductase n=1 Tax=Sorangium sp. So ce204 TaxID=3133288 RepID=UPI003F613451
MKYSVLGPAGVRVSKVCMGTATFGVAPSSQDADAVVAAALDLGINFFDTADVYGNMPVFDRAGAALACTSSGESAEPAGSRGARQQGNMGVVVRRSDCLYCGGDPGS